MPIWSWLASCRFCGVDRAVPLWDSLCHHVKREASRLHPIYALWAACLQ
jgi:hypothetical protein